MSVLELTEAGPVLLPLADLKIDPELQCRTKGVSRSVAAEYAALIEAGTDFPPVVVFLDNKGVHWLADGFHRVEAHSLAKRTEVAADVRQGSRKDALLFAAGANASHGLRRTTADKRRAIELVLGNFPKLSDRKIGEAVGVDHKTVSATRARLAPAEPGEIPHSEPGAEPREPAPEPDVLEKPLAKLKALVALVPAGERQRFADLALSLLAAPSE